MSAVQELLLNRLTTAFFSRKLLPRIFLIPTVLLLLTLAIGFLKSSPATPFLAGIGIAGFLASIFFRKTGLLCAFGALLTCLVFFYRHIPQEDRLWQMGLCIAWAANYLIVLLGLEEVAFSQREETANFQKEIAKVQNELQELQKEHAEERETLEAELLRWKEEAEQRRIEKRQDDKLLTLIQSEIALLTSQKEQFINDSFEARKAHIIAKQQLEDLEAHTKILQEDAKSLLQQQEVNKKHVDDLMLQLLEKEESYMQKVQELEKELQALEKAKSENACALNEKMTLASSEIDTLKNQLLEKEALYQEQLDTLNNCHHQDKVDLENQYKQSMNAQMLEIERLKIELEEAAIKVVESDELLEHKQALSQAIGLNKQLRSQFEEKSKILSQTRKELFQVQGKLMALEREMLQAELMPDLSLQHTLEKELQKLAEEKSSCEEEISSLETIISQLLSNN